MPNMKRILSISTIAILALNAWCLTMQEAVDLFVSTPSLRHAAAGVAVMRIDSGTVVASNLLDQAIVTASTMKTVTSAAALEILGGDFQFQTNVLLQGNVENDTLHGNIVIVGSGDPTLGSRYFPKNPNIVKEIITALKDKGISWISRPWPGCSTRGMFSSNPPPVM